MLAGPLPTTDYYQPTRDNHGVAEREKKRKGRNDRKPAQAGSSSNSKGHWYISPARPDLSFAKSIPLDKVTRNTFFGWVIGQKKHNSHQGIFFPICQVLVMITTSRGIGRRRSRLLLSLARASRIGYVLKVPALSSGGLIPGHDNL